MSRSAGVSTSRALFRVATAKDLLVPASLLRAPRARISLRVSSRIATLAPVVSAAATGRFALLHRVVAVSASTASGRLPAGASPHVACVTSLSPRRDRSASAHVSSRAGAFARAETRARRAGVVLAASRAAFGAFAAGASADSITNRAPDARSATDEPRLIEPATTMTSATTRVVVWFRNDLRLADNYVIKRAEALAAADPGVEVLPVYCFDPRCFERSAWGSPRTGAHRARFLRECVADLQSNLRLIGSDLLVVVGKPEEVIAPLVLGDGKTTVVLTQEETSSEEHAVDRAVAAAVRLGSVGAGSKASGLTKIWGSTLYHRNDLPYDQNALSDLPDGFTPFRNKVESKASVRDVAPPPAKGALPLARGVAGLGAPMLPLDALPFADPADLALAKQPVHAQSVLPFEGGERAALARVEYYVWQSEAIATYFETRNGMLGGDYSSKLAPWLAHGCVSPRHVASEVRRFERERVENKSTYWLIFELIWRDFYKFFAVKHGDAIFAAGGVAKGGRHKKWRADAAALEAWKSGTTGFPLVDANMRELAATGFMSNRGRQNVASWLALDAQVDWRLGAEYFESKLIDYDCSANWGNWVAAAGMTGGRVNRFNIAKQTKDYDPDGEYVKAWIPELRDVPGRFCADPRQMPSDVARDAKCVVGIDYPAPFKLPPNEFGGGGRGGGRGGRGGRGRGGRGGRGDGRDRRGDKQRRAAADDVYG